MIYLRVLSFVFAAFLFAGVAQAQNAFVVVYTANGIYGHASGNNFQRVEANARADCRGKADAYTDCQGIYSWNGRLCVAIAHCNENGTNVARIGYGGNISIASSFATSQAQDVLSTNAQCRISMTWCPKGEGRYHD